MFVPVTQVESYFHEVIKQLVVREELASILEYVERTWIGEWISSNRLLLNHICISFRMSPSTRSSRQEASVRYRQLEPIPGYYRRAPPPQQLRRVEQQQVAEVGKVGSERLGFH